MPVGTDSKPCTPCIAETAASPERDLQPDAGVDAALGSAFNTSGQSNDSVRNFEKIFNGDV